MTREAAWHVLRSASPAPMRDLDAICARAGLDARDVGLVRAICGTEIRRRGTLRAIVNTFVPRKPKPDLIAHLHIGLVQLLFLDRIPEHAAVSETSDAVARTVGSSKVPFVNGVLRTVLRARREGHSGDARADLVDRPFHFDREVFRDPAKHPLLWAEDALSLPAPLAKRWTRRYRSHGMEALARTFLHEPPLVLRALGDRDALVAELAEAGVGTRPGTHPKALIADPGATASVVSSGAFRLGRLTIQGEAAARAAELVDAKEGEEVLDLCCAPGGKTAILAATGAKVWASDIDETRLERARETAARLGVDERITFLVSDGTAAVPDRTFDAVLVDAPCTNTAVLGARPEARWRFGPRTLASVESLQTRLLQEASERVRPGGRLVWSTCSLEPEENQRRVATFLADHPDWTLQTDHQILPDATKGPFDGGYAALLVRSTAP
ncbi:MAG TPA: methyltransferase domain-containing protein [Planctomycetes bacterium]|nr:methyltransferase domain-containing protein [Planctomycetota bacterium]